MIEEVKIDSFDEEHNLKKKPLNKKYYCVDNGILYINCEDEQRKNSIILENAIYLFLRAKEIKPVGKAFLSKSNQKEGEIDFNYSLEGIIYHIQVTYILQKSDYKREIGNLLKLNDDSKKIIVYMKNYLEDYKNNNITYIYCGDFLLNN